MIFNICLIAIQVIERLEFIHSKDFIYRDVKPENLMIGIQDPNVIYIVDYGLCKKYRLKFFIDALRRLNKELK